MRLDMDGEASKITELLGRFAGRPWLYELEELHEKEKSAATSTGAVRVYPQGLATGDAIETGDGPYVVVVDGDLVTTDHVGFRTNDYVQARVIVTGELRAGSLSFANGARVIVEGPARIERACFGQYGDRNGVLSVHGELAVPFLALDWYTGAYAHGGIRALIYSDDRCWEEPQPDIINARDGTDGRYFRAEVLDNYGDLDIGLAIAAVRAGTSFLLPEVEESFPARLRTRAIT